MINMWIEVVYKWLWYNTILLEYLIIPKVYELYEIYGLLFKWKCLRKSKTIIIQHKTNRTGETNEPSGDCEVFIADVICCLALSGDRDLDLDPLPLRAPGKVWDDPPPALGERRPLPPSSSSSSSVLLKDCSCCSFIARLFWKGDRVRPLFWENSVGDFGSSLPPFFLDFFLRGAKEKWMSKNKYLKIVRMNFFTLDTRTSDWIYDLGIQT